MLPKGRNAKDIFKRVELGTLQPEEKQRYFAEIRRLYNKRNYAIDPARDARLSFTTNTGYRPQGVDLPAWKAVFFNPRTDETVIGRLIYSIEELI